MDNWVTNSAKTVSNKGGIFTFLRAQMSSQLASIVDNFVAFALANILAFVFHKPSAYFVLRATFIGQICGGITNCVVNYRWTFKSMNVKKRYVAVRYLIIWVISLFLNTAGTVLLTKLLNNSTWISDLPNFLSNNVFMIPKLVVSLLVGFIWNYNMHRLFVFKNLNIKQHFLKIKQKQKPEAKY